MADLDIHYAKILSELSAGIFCKHLVKRSYENGVQEQKLLLRTNGCLVWYSDPWQLAHWQHNHPHTERIIRWMSFQFKKSE